MNLYEKISAIMDEVKYLRKDDSVEYKTTKYKALSEEKVTSIMHDKLVKYKLVMLPIELDWSRDNNITHVNTTYKLINVENPEEFEIIASCGDGADTQDKGSGKAMTYAFKYAFLRTFAIPTGEDPDKVSTEEIEDNLKKEEAKKEKPKKCCRCKGVILPVKSKDGKNDVSPEEIIALSNKMFGKVYCADCMKIMKVESNNGGNNNG